MWRRGSRWRGSRDRDHDSRRGARDAESLRRGGREALRESSVPLRATALCRNREEALVNQGSAAGEELGRGASNALTNPSKVRPPENSARVAAFDRTRATVELRLSATRSERRWLPRWLIFLLAEEAAESALRRASCAAGRAGCASADALHHAARHALEVRKEYGTRSRAGDGERNAPPEFLLPPSEPSAEVMAPMPPASFADILQSSFWSR